MPEAWEKQQPVDDYSTPKAQHKLAAYVVACVLSQSRSTDAPRDPHSYVRDAHLQAKLSLARLIRELSCHRRLLLS